MKKSTLWSLICICLLIPGTLFLGTKLPGRWYYLTGTLIIIEAMLPFFFLFETRRPQARELVCIAVMAALAAVSRGAFAFIPHFKPIVAVVMITGMSFGAEAGFLTGAVSAFASNFFFGQGPFTPWQMMAYGLGGFLAGLLFHKRKRLAQKPVLHRVLLTGFGFLSVLLVVGPVLDLCSVFTMSSQLSWNMTVLCLSSGFLINVTHGISCALTLLLLGRPLMQKLERLQTKYGILEGSDETPV